MLKPNDLPLICLPTGLSDEAAAALVEFLQQLTTAIEQHYFAQLRRHYHQYRPAEPDLHLNPRNDDPSNEPPF